MPPRYWAVLQHSFQESINFRMEVLLWIFLDTFPTVILFFVWQLVFRNTAEINGYTFSDMVEFYFYFLVIINLTSIHFEEEHVQAIRDGKIDQYFTKPLPFPEFIFWEAIGQKIFDCLLLLP